MKGPVSPPLLWALILIIATLVGAGLSIQHNATKPAGEAERKQSETTLRALLGDSGREAGFPQVKAPRPFEFPLDHLGHPEYRSEWWYVTGHLRPQGATEFRYGFQLTLFRHALRPTTTAISGWSSPQVYMGHLALSDFQQEKHFSEEIISRSGPDLAGYAMDPPRVWVKSWRMESVDPPDWLPLRLVAQAPQQSLGLDLELRATTPPLLQGDRGFSPKGPNTASHYYSYPNLQVHGLLSTAEAMEIAVEGQAWFDHEWGSSYLEPGQQGWDWFSLQLDNGVTLMWFQIRSQTTELNTRAVTLADVQGNRLPLDPAEVEVTPLDVWSSPSGRRYPSGWQLSIPRYQISLRIEPRIKDQEMRLAVVYWEGAVTLSGSHSGVGYVELSGY
ncbi:lipocalin-like domain-containing protein [Aestuariirhabdus litorea]|uniref:Carotenoid 1,2-hydratase n=1 Tax=Aestuariirhabdus litorea TaxID=2528527 RepID=A0A3P3VTM8_9GAMM|nr:lipocalin-like domain-containing protein [Aestuariirhabdus litorea]RRJ85026.1 carotenoid 1,2-hydratase [Aestuariirhabdus litorea]RWW98251.1 carotenoid 1,2-hydratase [Endozoicomonadaceae bacterium GTF-13]